MKFLCRLRALGSDGDYGCMHAGKTADDISMTYTLRDTLEKTGKNTSKQRGSLSNTVAKIGHQK